MANPESPSPAEPGSHRWFVVANASRARAYVQRIGSPGYDVVRQWDSPQERMTAADPGEDRPSGASDESGPVQRVGAVTADAEASPKHPAQRDLMAALVEDLAQALRRREISGLYLLAPAPLLHRMKEALPTDLRHALVGEGTGDFTQRPTADVFAHLDRIRHEAGAGPTGIPRAS